MSNKIYLITLLALFVYANGYAQVVKIDGVSSGIRFQIDPLNNSSGASNVSDDFVITSDGKMGIGTITPRAKIEIKGKLRIVDGFQQDGAFLVSDNTGLGTWYDPDLIGRRIVWGEIASVGNLAKTYTNITSTALNLKGGLWMIIGRADIVGGGSGTEERPQFVWLKIEEKTTDSKGIITTKAVSEAGMPHMIRLGVYSQYYATPMIMGFVSVPVEGIAQKKREYYIYAKSPSSTYTSPKLTTALSGAYFYAIKLQ